MGHDVHFLERLERLEQEHLGLAVALYQNSALVRLVLKETPLRAAGPRVAIALDEGPAAPHVVVERASGHFVTVLAAGMRHDLPVISRAALQRAAGLRENGKEILAAVQAMNAAPDLVARVRALFVPRLSREEFRVLYAWSPALAKSLALEQIRCLKRYSVAWPALRDKERLRERDLPMVRSLWNQVVLLQNQMIFIARGARWPLETAGEELDPKEPEYLRLQYAALSGLTHLVSTASRGLAATLLLDVDDVLESAVRAYLHPTDERLWDGAFVLALLGVHAPARGPEIARLLAERPPGMTDPDDEDLALHARLRDVVVHPEEADARHRERARAYLAAKIGDVSGVAEADVLAANASRFDVIDGGEGNLALADMLPFLARTDPADLFLPAELLARFPKEEREHDALAYAEARRRLHREKLAKKEPAPPAVGRNDPCHCGSGRKFKKCHGATG